MTKKEIAAKAARNREIQARNRANGTNEPLKELNNPPAILYRQIAGFVARRIVSYATEVGKEVEQNSKCGFIKFGSRVDIFLPIGSKIDVALGDKVTGSQTILAHLPENK